jgi:hypothetical protein
MGVEKNRDSGVSKLCTTTMSLAFLGIWAGHIYNGLSERHIPGIDPMVYQKLSQQVPKWSLGSRSDK